MKHRSRGRSVLVAAVCVCLTLSNHIQGQEAEALASKEVSVVLVQMNDVYEIEPLSQPLSGGLARVATLVRQLRKKNPHTYVLLAGDFLSPSALGSATVDKRPIAGAQMVETLQSFGLDYAIFGNHEFDLDEESFFARNAELKGKLIACNVFDRNRQPFPGIPAYRTIEAKFGDATSGDAATDVTIRIALIGVTLPTQIRGGYATISDPISTARETVKNIKTADAIVAVSHLALKSDQELSVAIPEVDLILGGHEHENNHSRLIVRPTQKDTNLRQPASIFKADANAVTVYVHELFFDRSSRRLTRIDSQLRAISRTIPEDPKTLAVVEKWKEKAWKAFAAEGLNPDELVVKLTVELEGRDDYIRQQPTNLTVLLGDAMRRLRADSLPADLAVFNSGSIRVDDVIYPGDLRVYDVLRILPFGGDVFVVPMKGESILAILKEAVDPKHLDAGSFLQFSNVSSDKSNNETHWRIGGVPLDPQKTYNVAINDFLLQGREDGFAFVKEFNRGAQKAGTMRQALIDGLKRLEANRRD